MSKQELNLSQKEKKMLDNTQETEIEQVNTTVDTDKAKEESLAYTEAKKSEMRRMMEAGGDCC